MKNVSLEPFIWPCLYYCIQRVCPGMSVREFNELPRLDYNLDLAKHMQMGTILWYNNSEKEKEWQLAVRERTVISTYTFNRGHFMVYEGSDLVSDLAWHDDTPYIRFRKLAELSPPDKMIMLGR